MGRESISRNAREGVPHGLPRAADDGRQGGRDAED